MATLVLQTVGAVLGGIAAGPIGAVVGRAVGGLAGASVDAALFGGGAGTRQIEGPRLKDMDGLTSTEGAAVPRVYGRARIGGQLIWATRFEEVVKTDVQRSGTSGGKSVGGGASQKTAVTTYRYFANLAVGLCEGPIGFVRRVWADGREIDLSKIGMRVHRGTEIQNPDPLIVAKEGAPNAPAYRGLAYVVFERLPLADFGNRVPQLSFEVVRPVDGLGSMIRSVCLIPGAGEFAYEVRKITQGRDLGKSAPENRHQLQARSDVMASLDALQALCPNLKQVSVVVSWFGDDLRAGACTIAPRVEAADKSTYPQEWSVAGLDRASARVVSQVEGAPAYGGTPSDGSVIRLIEELKERGLKVALYPFVMMDISPGNSLPDPHTGAAGQPAYPWRGRITCSPAPGRPETPDGTPDAADQVAAFFDAEWGLRRQVLHYAGLAAEAGGVDGFIIGSELVGLTRVRSGAGSYPAVEALKTLAGEVRAVLGAGTKVTYAADWTEYGAHVLDGGAEVRFPLDALWGDPAVDAVGIDWYPPISDWRDGAHLDAQAARSVYDSDYLRERVAGGEGFDWFYAGAAARNAQVRTPITDGAYGKPWAFRPKDLVSWWSSAHVERFAGVETEATAWVPQSKPIWLTELGVPAVDKGTNGPNVFPDPKSSESAYPPHSLGLRDDLMQLRGLEAMLSRFDPAADAFEEAHNPISPVYGGRMVDADLMSVWAWDARPYPALPELGGVWADARNWQTGHWITGRLEGVALERLIGAVVADFEIAVPQTIAVDGFVDGYVVDRPMSARAALEPLASLFGVDAVAVAGALRWRGPGGRSATPVSPDALILPEGQAALRLVRAQETELPHQVEIGFTDAEGEYRRAAVGSRRLAGSSRREERIDTALVTRRAEAQRLADAALQNLWAARETAEFALSPRRLDFEPGDLLALPTQAGPKLHRVVRIADGPTRKLTTRSVEPAVYASPGGQVEAPLRHPPPEPGRPFVAVLDLPAARGDPTVLQYIAAAADPWPGALVLWRSADGTSFSPIEALDVPAIVGRTRTALGAGPLWRWDPTAVEVEISSGAIASIPEEAALAGGNLFGIRGPDGRWEILSAAVAELIGERTYRLSRLLRGLSGSEPEAARTVPPGATIVRLDGAVVPLTATLSDLGQTWRYRLGPADRDHADDAAVAFSATAGPDALKPLSPVRVRARRSAERVEISWVRRTRRDGDAWEPLDVPLGEDREAYEVDILQDGAVVRTLSASEPRAAYLAADEAADFGGQQATLSLRIAQLSAAVGRGFERSVVLPVA